MVDLAKTMGQCGTLAGTDLGLVKLLEGDLAVAGKPLSKAKPTKADRVASLALEHYRALAWLVAPASTLMSSIDTAIERTDQLETIAIMRPCPWF